MKGPSQFGFNFPLEGTLKDKITLTESSGLDDFLPLEKVLMMIFNRSDGCSISLFFEIK